VTGSLAFAVSGVWGAEGDDPARRRPLWAISTAVALALHAGGGLVLLPAMTGEIPPPPPPPLVMALDLAPAPTPAPAPMPAPRPVEAPPPPPAKPVAPRPALVRPATPRPALPPRPIPVPPSPAPAADAVAETAPAPVPAAPPAAAPPAASPPARPASVDAEQAATTWQSSVVARLEQLKRYPAVAQARRQHGVAVVRIVMGRDGQVRSVRLERSSGVGSLDGEAVDLPERAQPLPPPPPEIKGDPLELIVPIQFHLRR